jgi:PAS domain S-box-containing protein
VHASRAGTGWEPLFWQVFERSANPIALVDEDRRHVEVNDSWLKLTGRSREALIGRSVVDGIRPSEREQSARAWEQLLQAGEYSGARALLRDDGSEVDMEFASRLTTVEDRRLAVCVALADGGDSHVGTGEHPAAEVLSNREREVVTFIALGRDSGQIAQELHVSVETGAPMCGTRCPSSEPTRGRSSSRSPSAPAMRFTEGVSTSNPRRRPSARRARSSPRGRGTPVGAKALDTGGRSASRAGPVSP